MTPRRASAGFTLIEIVIVLVVLSIVLALVAPAFAPSVSRFAMRTTSNMVIAELRAARMVAISTGRTVRVAVSGNRLVRDDGHRSGLLDGRVALAGGDERSIAFFPHGASTGGLISVRRGGEERAFAINWLTGRVREN